MLRRWVDRDVRTNTSAAGELLRLDDALSALGHDGVLDDRLDEVPLDDIVGTVARSADFDGRFGLVGGELGRVPWFLNPPSKRRGKRAIVTGAALDRLGARACAESSLRNLAGN